MDGVFDPAAISYLSAIDQVRALHPAPMSRATDKVIARLDKHCRAIIARSTFVLVGTHGARGADVSPRGDPPGFVRVLDDLTLLLPDRIGNNRLDTMSNLLVNARIGLIFLVPGMNETLRINGTARITDDPRLLAPSAVNNRAPRVGLVVTV
ncbi:MAG: pyridoxamine 5'-phosphate oxidase family protein, partial [Alphaproteobacteria bacterium]|nr:pyridoxamine 5'-phosphate oxidase family protein [Alphaproteobacteria bacterium]